MSHVNVGSDTTRHGISFEYALIGIRDLLFAEKEKPFSVDVFEDQLYVATYNNYSIFRINKFGYGNATVLAKGLRRPATIVIVQEQKQDQKREYSGLVNVVFQSDIFRYKDRRSHT